MSLRPTESVRSMNELGKQSGKESMNEFPDIEAIRQQMSRVADRTRNEFEDSVLFPTKELKKYPRATTRALTETLGAYNRPRMLGQALQCSHCQKVAASVRCYACEDVFCEECDFYKHESSHAGLKHLTVTRGPPDCRSRGASAMRRMPCALPMLTRAGLQG